jgi:hypothetical protein
MRESPERWGERPCTVAAAGLLALACATPVSLEAGRFRARDGASIADLSALEPGWRRFAAEGPLLAFRAEDGASASWLRLCRGAAAPARAEARALLMGLEDVALEREGPVEIAGAEGWALVARARERGRDVAVKAVTRVAAGCIDDFLLVTPSELAPREAGFDRWWASFADAPGGDAG